MKEAELQLESQSTVVFDSVDQSVKEYRSNPHTPELVTKVYQTIWQARGELIGAVYGVEMTPCPYTQEELKDLEQQRKRVGYLPLQLASQENRHILGKIFPKMGSYSIERNNLVTNDGNPSGWFDYEAGIDAPYLDTDEQQLTERIAEDKRKLLSLNQYIIASQDSKLLTGQYLDEGRTWTRSVPAMEVASSGLFLSGRPPACRSGSRVRRSLSGFGRAFLRSEKILKFGNWNFGFD